MLREGDERPMRIMQVLLSPRIGGAEALAESLSQHWTRHVVDETVTYLDGSKAGRLKRFRRVYRLQRDIARFRPDLILAHSAIPNLYSRIVAAKSRTPVVTVLHSASDDFQSIRARIVERLLLPLTAHVVAVSESQKVKYESYFRVSNRISLVPNGIRNDISSRELYRPKPTHLVTVARVARQKNPELWVRVVAQLKQLSPEYKLVWWGPVTDEDGVSDLVRDFSDQGTTGVFAGPTSDPSSAYESADACFHPSDREAHSIGILEAAASGLPIICSKSVARTLPPLINAITFDDDSADSAIRAISLLRNEWPRFASEAIENATKIQSTFSIANCADKYMDLFHVILDTPPTRRP